MKKIWFFAIIILVSVAISGCSSSAQNNNQANLLELDDDAGAGAVVYFFWGDGCPHCEVQKPFLEEMKNKYSGLLIKDYETWKNRDNATLLQEMATAYGTRASGVPMTFIGDGEPFVGFAESMETEMENRIKTCVENGCINPGNKLK